MNFKSQLKKTNKSFYAQPGAKEETESGMVNFKSALRKVNPNKPPADPSSNSQDLGFRASLRSVSGDLQKRVDPPVATTEEEIVEDATIIEEIEEEDKRKSTGSISSLVKMWEPSSPKESSLTPSPCDTDRPGSVVKFEKRVWPPVPSTETEKPMVPVKPTVKPPPTSKPPPPREPVFKPPPKPPSTAAKPQVCNIYAAPSSMSSRAGATAPRPNISTSKPKLIPTTSSSDKESKASEGKVEGSSDKRGESSDSGLSSDRDSLLDCSSCLDNELQALAQSLSKGEAMAVSDKVGTFHSSCINYVDSIPATGRFRFRSLLNKLDTQVKDLRSVNINKSSETEKLVKEIQMTIRDLGAVIQR